ncbi:MAG: hypothetical protein EXX96DRAFT_539341 [Benjaminiella poitrasii]|nr:MAG: hypothetical protein EXX96DRAFT_539341 [Benjaminiella poitrasii]
MESFDAHMFKDVTSLRDCRFTTSKYVFMNNEKVDCGNGNCFSLDLLGSIPENFHIRLIHVLSKEIDQASRHSKIVAVADCYIFMNKSGKYSLRRYCTECVVQGEQTDWEKKVQGLYDTGFCKRVTTKYDEPNAQLIYAIEEPSWLNGVCSYLR